MRVEVVYATKKQQSLIEVELVSGSTIGQAVQKSGLLSQYAELVLKELTVGVFSKRKSINDQVYEGQRIEIYRPLEIGPKEARRLRAQRAKTK